MATTALKMAAICMLVLTMMGQLMAAASASAPLVQADAAPTARRLLSADHERSASEKTGNCPCGPPVFDPECCIAGLLKTTGSCDCNLMQPWCCDESQKTMMLLLLSKKTGSCPCSHLKRPWCCDDAQKARMSLLLSKKTAGSSAPALSAVGDAAEAGSATN